MLYKLLLGPAICFSATDNISENLQLCKNLCIGLISQRIHFAGTGYYRPRNWKCIQDNPIIVSFGALANLYPQTPLAEDIAGTKESISEITVENLKENFSNFYHPSNMTLFVIGNFDLAQIAAEIEEQQEN